LTIFITNNMAMKMLNVAEAKAQFSHLLEEVVAGETVLVCKRNVPMAQITAIAPRPFPRHTTTVGWAAGSGLEILGDLTDPLLPATDWEMLA